MLHYIKGIFADKTEDFLVVENQGLGYKIYVPSLTETKLPATGETIHLYVHMVVREDNLTLYGFLTEEELSFFKSFITVSGIGPRAALSLLGSFPPSELYRMISSQDSRALTTIKGVGKKSAQRIILELKDKLPQVSETAAGEGRMFDNEAREALLSLGYSLTEAMEALGAAEKAGAQGRDELIKQSLKYLAERR